jgi:hypothetical protein
VRIVEFALFEKIIEQKVLTPPPIKKAGSAARFLYNSNNTG